MTAPLTTQAILATESFRLLNAMIDEKAQDLKDLDDMISGTCRRIGAMDLANPDDVQEIKTRTFEEVDAGADTLLTLDIKHQMENLASMAKRRNDLLGSINELQVAKLRLLNDYDFTRGDDAFQRAILTPEGSKC